MNIRPVSPLRRPFFAERTSVRFSRSTALLWKRSIRLICPKCRTSIDSLYLARARAEWWAKNKLPESLKEAAWRTADFIGGSLTAVAEKFSTPEYQDIESAFLVHRRGYQGKVKLQ